MRIILLAFFLTFTWAILAKDENVTYKVTGVKTRGRIEKVLVLSVESDEFGRENMWVYFSGSDQSVKSLEIFEKRNIGFVKFIEREGRTVFHSDEVKMYNDANLYVGNLNKELPKKSLQDRFAEVWNEGLFNVN